MGQQNVLYRTQDNEYEKYSKLSACQIDSKYVWEKFRVGEKVKKDTWRHSYLMKETLAQDNCEIVDYIHYKLNEVMKRNCNFKFTSERAVSDGSQRSTLVQAFSKNPTHFSGGSCQDTCNIVTYIDKDFEWEKIEW